jgi:hypothetical protein
MVIQSVWLSGTVGLVVTSIPIHMVIVGLGGCYFAVFMLYLSLLEICQPYLQGVVRVIFFPVSCR